MSVPQYSSVNGDGSRLSGATFMSMQQRTDPRTESPSNEVCAYTDLLCGFFRACQTCQARARKSILFPATWIPFPLTSATLPR